MNSFLDLEQQPPDIIDKCLEMDTGYVYDETPEIKVETDTENLEWASGGFHDARILKEELQEDGTLYLRFDGTWGCEIEVWFWGDLEYDTSSRDPELYDPYWFGSTVILQDGFVFFVDDDDMTVDQITKDYCYFKARSSSIFPIPCRQAVHAGTEEEKKPEQDDTGLYMKLTIPKKNIGIPVDGQKVAVITGGASGIGKCITEEFRKQGVKVYVIDKAAGDHYVGNISDKAGFITGENICIDGGMTKLMIYHDDHGWTYTPGSRKIGSAVFRMRSRRRCGHVMIRSRSRLRNALPVWIFTET